MADARIWNEYHYWECRGCKEIYYTDPKLNPCPSCGRKRTKRCKGISAL